MRKTIARTAVFAALTLLAGLAAFSPLLAGPAPSDPPAGDSWILTGARVLSPEGAAWRHGYAVRVVGNRIEAILPESEVELSEDDRHVDATGLYLVPGLIDLHSHLLLHPYDETSWNDQVLKESLELRVARGVAAAEATLHAGFTTLRDLGTEGAAFADAGIRDAIEAGIVPGPRVFAATRAIVATGCYGPSGFDPRWEMPVGAQVADGPEGVRKAVREQIAAGADWIKVYADYRRRPGDASTPTFSQAELDAIVDEAKSAGLPVASHAVTDEAIRRSVLAGVRTIEHGYDVSEETLGLMRDRGVILCPTLTASESIARYQGWTPVERDRGDGAHEDEDEDEDERETNDDDDDAGELPERVRKAKAMFERALESGVGIACGSDVGVFAHGDNARELELMVDYGMSPTRALQSATSIAAAVLGRESDLGRITPGALADLAAFREDPLESPSALRDPVLVAKDGAIIVDRRDQLAADDAVAVCHRFVGALTAKDIDALGATLAPEAVVYGDYPALTEPAFKTREAFLEGTRAAFDTLDSVREWISGEATARIDNRIATVHAPYALEAGPIRAVGSYAFQLVRLEGEWKIVSLTYTHRRLATAGG